MKKLILLFAISISINGLSQLDAGNTYLSVRGGMVTAQSFESRIYGGLELDVMAWDKVGIHYSLLAGERYFHMPLAPFGGVALGLIIGSTEDEDGDKNIGAAILIGLLTAIIPEGISYNHALNEKLVVSPYISPLQFEYMKRRGQRGGTDSYAGGGIGGRFHFYASERLRLTTFAEYKIHYYRDIHPGVSFGLNVSYNLTDK